MQVRIIRGRIELLRCSARLGSIILNVTDIDKTAADYKLLGMEEWDHRGEAPNRVVQFNVSSKTGKFPGGISLHETKYPAPLKIGKAFVHIGLAVSDVHAVCKRLADANMPCLTEPKPLPLDNNVIIAMAKDPDGRMIELIQER